VLLSLPDSKVVEAVVEGEDGVLAHCRAGQIVVDLSTAAASSTIRLAKRLFAERGVQYVDAGISGGAAAAEKGALTLMVGGDADAVAALQWAFKRRSVRRCAHG
jgi:3-hydroxyisobutyrate dehydrogenase